jgi:hypothetical protein
MSSTDTPQPRHNAVDNLAGFLAAASITLSGISIAQPPAVLAPIAALIALVAARMSVKYEKLSLFAMATSVVMFILGMSIAVITKNPLI